MTDYSVADDIAAVWDSVRPVLAGAFHADTYQLVSVTRVSDGRGGTTTVEAAVEAGRCGLTLSGAQGRESLSGDVVQSVYRAAAEMPVGTLAEADDVLDVNGRRYQIIAITHPGSHGTFPVAELEAVS